MRLMIFTAPLAVLIATAAGVGPASAAPISAAPPAVATHTGIIQVDGCHNGTRGHYVPEWGFATVHHHKGRYCTPIQDENDVPGHRYRRFDGPTIYFKFGDDDYDRRRDRRRRHSDDY